MTNLKKLTLLHSNDMHGDFFAEGENKHMVGGISRLSGYIQNTRKNEKNCLYVVSGDMFQGSIIDTEYKGFSTIDIMNLLNPDVVTLGNHEIDYGLAHLMFLEKIAQFPIINANMYIKNTGARLFQPYYIKEIDGMKIMFIGIITQEIIDYAKQDEHLGGFVNVETAAAEVGKICNAYRKIDIDFTILMTHIGYENDVKLAKLLDPAWGVDLIIGGHSHTKMEQPEKVNDILICQVQGGTDQIGRFDINIDTDNNCVYDYKRECIPIDEGHCPLDKKMENLLSTYKEKVNEKYDKILGRMKRDLLHQSRDEETECGNLFADILKEYLGLDIMCMGTGSIRKEVMDDIVTLKELKEIYPYGGKVYDVKLTGKELKDMINHIFVNKFANDAKEFYARSKGINIVYNKKTNEIEDIKYMGKNLDDDTIYNVGIQSFHLDNAKEFFGLDTENLKSGKKPVVICTDDFDILKEYFIATHDICAEVEGRISFKE